MYEGRRIVDNVLVIPVNGCLLLWELRVTPRFGVSHVPVDPTHRTWDILFSASRERIPQFNFIDYSRGISEVSAAAGLVRN